MRHMSAVKEDRIPGQGPEPLILGNRLGKRTRRTQAVNLDNVIAAVLELVYGSRTTEPVSQNIRVHTARHSTQQMSGTATTETVPTRRAMTVEARILERDRRGEGRGR